MQSGFPAHNSPLTGKKTTLALLVIVFLFLGWSCLYAHALLGPFSARSRPVSVLIPPNSPSRAVGEILSHKGVIGSPYVFDLYTRVLHLDKNIKPGSYLLSPDLTLHQIIAKLVDGPPDVSVTIPAGYTVEEIAARLAQEGLVNKEDFIREADYGYFNYPFLQGIPLGPGRLEGFLFPDTYRFSPGSGATHVIIKMMLNRFEKEITRLDYVQKARDERLTLRQAVTMASIIEREARRDSQRPQVAAVIMNRLKINMPLQSDATVVYALGGRTTGLVPADFKVDSPYNTYLHTGLPPGPIASPGQSSLLAAVEPAHNNYLYFVSKPDGTLVFARTLTEQLRNENKYWNN